MRRATKLTTKFDVDNYSDLIETIILDFRTDSSLRRKYGIDSQNQYAPPIGIVSYIQQEYKDRISDLSQSDIYAIARKILSEL